MPITKIERIVSGLATGVVQRDSAGNFICHHFGSNVAPLSCVSLDDVADFLRTYPRSGVRMNPGWVKISRNIYIDGVRLR